MDRNIKKKKKNLEATEKEKYTKVISPDLSTYLQCDRNSVGAANISVFSLIYKGLAWETFARH